MKKLLSKSKLKKATIELIGAPFSIGSRVETSYSIDQSRAPDAIRKAMNNLLSGFDIVRHFNDNGNLRANHQTIEVLNAIRDRVFQILANKGMPFVLGGAHTITLGSLRALKEALGNFSLIYFDAHPDLMPHASINYGSSLYYAIKEKLVLPHQIALLGIRQIERAEQSFIVKNKIYHRTPLDFEKFSAVKIAKDIKKKFKAPYCLSIDLDSIDPAVCQGVTTPYPCGLTVREILCVAEELCRSSVCYVDIVELSPKRDRKNISAEIAAEILLSISRFIASN